MAEKSRWHISTIGAVVLAITSVCAMIGTVAFSNEGFSNRTTPVVVSIIGLCTSVVAGLMTHLRAETANAKANEISDDLNNGDLTAKIRQAIREEHEAEERRRGDSEQG